MRRGPLSRVSSNREGPLYPIINTNQNPVKKSRLHCSRRMAEQIHLSPISESRREGGRERKKGETENAFIQGHTFSQKQANVLFTGDQTCMLGVATSCGQSAIQKSVYL